jgi:hypothetical protein
VKNKIGSLMVLLLVAGTFQVLTASVASAADPDHVTESLVICDAGSASGNYIPNPDGQGFICSTLPQSDQDTKDFYSGNAGKGWNEFDLVPFRLTLSAGTAAPSTQTYSLAVVVDGAKTGSGGQRTGFDRITEPSLNLALSDTGCSLDSVDATTPKTPGFNQTDYSLYRVITITQPKNTDCVIDWNGRLSIGSHLYPGSSLHGSFANAAVTNSNQDRSIPVNEIKPQSIEKDLSAVQDAAMNWDITKSPSPATIEFGNICNTGNTELTSNVDVTVTWTKLGSVPSDKVEVTTHVYATNPAHRSITVDVKDEVSSGGTLLYTVNSNGNIVPANTTSQLILSDTRQIDASSVVNGHLTNVATASYFDAIFNEPVPGNTTDTAEADVQVGTTTDTSVDITDTESITGNGLKFKVAALGAGEGAFTNYTAGTATTGPVNWALNDQTDSGSVTFHKTVILLANTGSTTGTLTDTATLTGDTISKSAGPLNISISSTVSGSVTVSKSTTVPVDVPTDFKFDVLNSSQTKVGSITVHFDIGATSGTGSLGGLGLGSYTLHETASGGFTPASDTPFTIALGTCDVTVPIANTFSNATASALKVTDPAGLQDGWEFTLYLDKGTAGPNPVSEDTPVKTVTTSASGLADFGEIKDQGNYYILETEQTGWTSDKGKDCTFTVDYPTDAGKKFDSCVFTNTQLRGHIIVDKVTTPVGSTQSFEFDPSYSTTNFFLKDSDTPNDSGPLLAGTYSVAEVTPLPADWELTSATCDDGSAVNAISLQPGETVTCTFNDRQRGHVTVKKTTDGVVNPDRSIDFTLTGPGLPAGGVTLNTFGDADGVLDGFPSLTPGAIYTVCENPVPAGFTSFWKLDGAIVTPYNPNASDTPPQDLGVRCYKFSVTAGQTVAFVIDNSHPGGEPRTIGYWKNWNQCTGGGQAAVADKNGGADAGFFLVEDLLPQQIGDFDVTLCTQAVKILSKQDQSGKSKANDAAYELAAQLLAAKLNLAAGAETCTAVQTAVAQGQALLANDVSFTGSGDYLGPKVKGALLTLRNQALSLATTLDRYNNGNLC